ncbi:STAS domain-containing protein [Acanthopleuribacter pedis]|uniref:STAS domain-containing protein n=1 Tax=Acanthopleuribacter pedis TaxID=442870 RepID=A0A8J7QDN1_9BACT|nr:STAS domain-containing protein [Acanthopleuribacter pedis]MBO1317690.1 STAS domain-containing protein [Acanthopleuribacter pedis]
MFEEIREGEGLTVKIQSDLVASGSKELKARLVQLVEGGEKLLTLDFHEVKVIDSAGIGVLISTQNSLKQGGQKLKLIGVREPIFKMLKIMRLDKHFEISGVA